MNMRLACDQCGSQPCICVEAECKRCKGEGSYIVGAPELDFVQLQTCADCVGAGWVKCNRGGISCPFDHCYCEAAWERQQADIASEPPMSAREQHEAAYRQKQELRR